MSKIDIFCQRFLPDGEAEPNTVNVSLTPTLEAFVREKVASGLYNNASEAVREALRRWIELEPPGAAGRRLGGLLRG
jgi:hypothetical protein